MRGGKVQSPSAADFFVYYDAKFTSDGRRMATLSGPWNSNDRFGTTRLRMWALRQPTAHPLRFAPGHTMGAASFSPDGTRLATADLRGFLWIIDAATAKPIAGPLTNGLGYLRGLAWTPDGRRSIDADLAASDRSRHRLRRGRTACGGQP